jgi:amino acid transporter
MDLAYILVEFVCTIFILIAFIVSTAHRDKTNLIPIQIYILSCLILNIVDLAYLIFGEHHDHPILHAIQNIQTILEIILILYFFFVRLKRKGFRITLLIFILFFLTTCGILWIKTENGFFKLAADLLGIEAFLITSASLLYLYEILSSNYLEDLRSHPNLIITCGVLFNFGITVPIYFCWDTLSYLAPESEKILSIVSQICFNILLVSIVKAYLCPLPKQQR